MKIFKSTFLICSILCVFGAKSQNMGFIDYDIEIKGVTPDLKKAAALLIDSKMKMSYIDSAVRQDYTLGQVTKKTTILNYKLNQAIYYENGMTGKSGIFGTCDQISSLIQVDTTAKIEFTKETKIILTFVCKKAILHFNSGEVAEYWYTNEIPLKLPKHSFFNAKIPGVILEFSTTANGFFMRFKCSNYGDKLEGIDTLFDPKTTRDYKMMGFSTYIQYLYIQQQEKLKNNPEN